MDSKNADSGRIDHHNQPSSLELGRNNLADWEAAQPSNFFTADLGFQRSLEYRWGLEKYRKYAAQLYKFGEVVARKVNSAVIVANRSENLPRLERFDAWGNRREEIYFHPSHHEAGKHIYGSGIMGAYTEPGANLLALAIFYLSSQNGEAGHNCPLACTAGLIRVLMAVGSKQLQKTYLPRLFDPEYDTHFHGAQFLTEVQGGSDVGANAAAATPTDRDGEWLLNGEKWFCSNITADLSLVTARVHGQGDGTKGLGLFMMPRFLGNGQPNSVYIQRLKDKLGTRSLATGEIEFKNAVAYQVGATENGFKNVMNHVINTSRIYNAMAVCGNARRAYVTASTYAQHRRAFDRAIVHYPIVQDILANMRADVSAILSGSLHIINLQDQVDLGKAEQATVEFLRFAINLNKYRSAIYAHQTIVSAIEVLGGNGAIETFSVLPRLLRDNIVYENWEGTHNVLLSQLQRDIRRYRIDRPFMAITRELLEELSQESLRSEGLGLLDRIVAELDEVTAMDELTAGIYFRPLMDRLADLYYATCLLGEADWEVSEKRDGTKLRLATLFFNRRAAKREPKDIAYYDDLVSRLCI
ncbi:MAG TPA: acyl-CoA dehydrogenase family protein [candidate division Zixibacteria bacterium]|nr:acyl-CoA dehydrogenase family protein [candidate division Zixibacteria bacterium]